MESLLSLSFGNLSSRDSHRISKGLRQIEGLLARLCLPTDRLSPHKRKNSSPEQDPGQYESKGLRDLRKDAAFREFFRLQESFQWNVASRLLATLERLMGMSTSDSSIDLIITSTLSLLQGGLLLHPPSRTLFTREDYMNLVLDLLDYSNPPRIQSQALLVLVTALLDCPANTRCFETVDGLLTVTSLFKSRGTTKEVKMRTLEFLYFYLMPEAAPASSASVPNAGLPRSPTKGDAYLRHSRTHSGDGAGGMEIDGDEGETRATKTMAEKQRLLGRYLNNVAELVHDLQDSVTFSETANMTVGG